MSVGLFVLQGGRIGRLTPTLHEVVSSRGLTIAFGTGELHGEPLAAALAAEWFSVTPDALLRLDSATAWAGATMRAGRKVLQVYLLGPARFDAKAALEYALCDSIAEHGEDGDRWLDRWIAKRDLIALESAAALVRLRGGDRLERAEFGRLFAAGGPQAGLRAFLGRKSR